MPISIKNKEVEELARKVAAFTGESITEAVRVALADRYERLSRERTGRTLIDELNEIAMSCARLPVICDLSNEEILGYDHLGIPTR